jgi:IS605 OrfB family transposase
MRCVDFDHVKKRFNLKSMKKLGGIKWRAGKTRTQLPNVIANVKISLKQGKWYAFFQHEIDPNKRALELQERNAKVRNNRAKSKDMLGADVGVIEAIGLSDGRLIANPRFLKKYAADTANLQREMARLKPKPGQRSSIPYKQVCAAFGRLTSKIARCRDDWQHKISRKLVDTHSWFAFEDLRILNMTKSAKGTVEKPGKNVAQKAGLNRSILDVGWGDLRTKVRYKAVEAGGGIVLVNPSYTSQACSRCDHVDSKSRVERGWFVCTQCGLKIHADVNAGRNQRKRGLVVLKLSIQDAKAA